MPSAVDASCRPQVDYIDSVGEESDEESIASELISDDSNCIGNSEDGYSSQRKLDDSSISVEVTPKPRVSSDDRKIVTEDNIISHEDIEIRQFYKFKRKTNEIVYSLLKKLRFYLIMCLKCTVSTLVVLATLQFR